MLICAIDMQHLIDILRPLSGAGVRPERFSKMVLELHTKRHTKCAIRLEQELRMRRKLDPAAEGEPLSAFGDKLKYAGCVPNGKYFSDVLKAFGRITRNHMDAEVSSVRLILHHDFLIVCYSFLQR